MDGGEQSVAAKTLALEDCFCDLISQLELDNKNAPVQVEAAIDALDKFKLWAGNIGARHSPESALSLEARLVTAKRVFEQVVDILGDLNLALHDLLEIVSGSRDNRPIIYERLMDVDNSSSPKPNQEYDSSSRLETDEAQDIFQVISECTRGLLKISILIRRATPRDRFAKALQGDNPFIDQFDISYVAERYPKLSRPEYKWLCTRLGQAITKRRQFLRYSRDHGSRIAGISESNEAGKGKSSAIIDAPAAVVEGVGIQAPSAIGTKQGSPNAARTHASTKASTLDIARLQQLREDEANNEDSRSFISAGSSVQVGNGDLTLHLPTLQQISKGDTMFECPFCFGIQTFVRESAWTRHAYRDLKAYVCTMGDGQCDFEMFGDSRAWFDHELQFHRKQWICVLCQKGPFKTPEHFDSHAKAAHADVLVENSQLSIFMNAGQRAVDAIPATECPFCDEWEGSLRAATSVPDSVSPSDVVLTVEPMQFRRHVAFHMEQLALFAIPRNLDDDEQEEATGQGVAPSHSTAINQSASSKDGSSELREEEWVLVAPLHAGAGFLDLVSAGSQFNEEVARLSATIATGRDEDEDRTPIWREFARFRNGDAASQQGRINLD